MAGRRLVFIELSWSDLVPAVAAVTTMRRVRRLPRRLCHRSTGYAAWRTHISFLPTETGLSRNHRRLQRRKRLGQLVQEVPGQEADFSLAHGHPVAREAVGEARDAGCIEGVEALRQEAPHDAGEHVARAPRGHAGVAGRDDGGAAVGGHDDRPRAPDFTPDPRGELAPRQAVGLSAVVISAAGHLARMRGRTVGPRRSRHPVPDAVERVGVEDERGPRCGRPSRPACACRD
jgi:hypothetical protein